MSYAARWLFVLLASAVGGAVGDLPANHENRRVRPAFGESSPRLILTDLIESGNIATAQELAKVIGGPFPDDIPSYSGFFTVNKEYNSNLFFWFFPAETDYESAPVLLWLQGGPGASSLFGLFTELGPFKLDFDNETLIPNPYSWHKNHSIVFIDNPVGTGFSFTDDDLGFATNQTQVGADLYTAMIQFFTLFPELQPRPFFIAGESFAGKYVPALGYTIHNNNPTAALKINLQGISVGNGITDPDTLFEYSEYFFQLGLVDTKTRKSMHAIEDEAREYIRTGQYKKAFDSWSTLLDLWSTNSGYYDDLNILQMEDPSVGGDFEIFMQRPEVCDLLHVGHTKYSIVNSTAYEKMIPEFMVTVKPWLEVLMDHYRVLYYSGQLDVIVAYPLSVNMYQTLNYSHTAEYLSANRTIWIVDGDIAGYTKTGGLFTEVLVRNAGHLVAKDQPVWALELISRFTANNMP